jgi:hypothetical protein
MKENLIYNLHATRLVKGIPVEDLNLLINLFMQDAGVTMGNDFNDKTLDMVITIIKNEFSFLPVFYIAAAFKKGAMGKYGPGRLVPRTIGIWIESEAMEYNKYLAHKEQKEKEFTPDNSFDLNKYPVGSAIAKKIDWYNRGIISSDDWDKVALKEMAERINQGLECVPEVFGLQNLKPKKI